MTARWRVAVGLLLAVGGASAYFALRPAHGGREAGGPLAAGSKDGSFSTGAALNPGEKISFGLLVVRNPTGDRITLERVELIDATKGMRMLGSYAQPPSASPGVGLLYGFPPAGAGLHAPVAGYRIAPGAAARVVVGLTVDGLGRARFQRLGLDYRSASRRYRADWQLAVQLCAPKRTYFGKCPAPR